MYGGGGFTRAEYFKQALKTIIVTNENGHLTA